MARTKTVPVITPATPTPQPAEVLRRARTDADFYDLLGPFLARRAVVAAVGGPVWDDDGKRWSVARRGGAVVGFVGRVDGDGKAALSSAYVPSGDAAVWSALLADATDGAPLATATVGKGDLPHFKRAGFKVARERGRFFVVERAAR